MKKKLTQEEFDETEDPVFGLKYGTRNLIYPSITTEQDEAERRVLYEKFMNEKQFASLSPVTKEKIFIWFENYTLITKKLNNKL